MIGGASDRTRPVTRMTPGVEPTMTANPDSSIPTGRFRSARASRSFDEMFSCGKEILAVNPGQPTVLRGMARTLDELGRTGDALPLWTTLRHLDATDAEAALHVAKNLVGSGMEIHDAVFVAAPEANDLFRAQLEHVLGAPGFRVDGSLQHVAICGVSFCGSTILDRVLGGLPGVCSIGESHWLTKESNGVKYIPIDLSVARTGRGPFCSVCGPKCKFLTSEFRMGLVADPSRWYFKIAKQLGTSILISADKNTTKLIDNDPLLRFAALVLFKSPLQAWASQMAKLPKEREGGYYAAELTKYMEVWTNSYKIFLNELNPTQGKTFLKFDDFVQSPRTLLMTLCAAVNLPYDPSVLQETRQGHAIGGNAGAMARLRAADYGVRLMPLPNPELPAEHSALIAGNKAMQDCYGALMARYREVFPLVR